MEKGERGPPWSAVICLTQSFRGLFGLFSPSPMNGCRQGISDGHDKISQPQHLTLIPPTRPSGLAFHLTRLTFPPRAGSERQSKVVSC